MRWSGNPQIGVRLPPSLFHAVRGEARLLGMPASHILRRLIQEWYQAGIAAAPGYGQDGQADDPKADYSTVESSQTGPTPRPAPTTLAEMLRPTARAPSPHAAVRDNGIGSGAAIPTRLVRPSATRSLALADVVLLDKGDRRVRD
jgi:hypothetical protein